MKISYVGIVTVILCSLGCASVASQMVPLVGVDEKLQIQCECSEPWDSSDRFCIYDVEKDIVNNNNCLLKEKENSFYLECRTMSLVEDICSDLKVLSRENKLNSASKRK